MTSMRKATPRGFTLIEVLIGIIVLGLGLLGLAAIFPAVVVQQRQASDAVLGESVVKSARSLLESMDRLNAPSRGWDSARNAEAGTRKTFGVRAAGPDDLSGWELPFVTQDVANAFSSDSDTGEMLIGDTADTATLVRVPVRARLFPLPRLGQGGLSDEPKYVWDIAVRRVVRRAVGTNRRADVNDPLEVAVFVRRIDTGVRRAVFGEQGFTFHDRFEPSVGGTFEFLPVVVNTSTGVPTFDGRVVPGTVEYSGINRVSFDLVDALGATVTESDRIVLREKMLANGTMNLIGNDEREFYSLVGQKVLMESGKRLTVIRTERLASGDAVMVVDRVVDALDLDPVSGAGHFGLMTPQIPVAIETFIVEKPSVQ